MLSSANFLCERFEINSIFKFILHPNGISGLGFLIKTVSTKYTVQSLEISIRNPETLYIC